MQKIIKVNKTVIAVLSEGFSFQRDDLTEKEFQELRDATTDEEIRNIMDPSCANLINVVAKAQKIINKVEDSKILTLENNCIYWKEISLLSLPQELADSIIEAENNKDELKLETYKNFWTLMSLNPDEECRKNLFEFLMRHDLVISRCGFFISYRNADLIEGNIKTSNKEDLVFTDQHTHTTRIQIGKMMLLDRDKCDTNSNHECSSGLKM